MRVVIFVMLVLSGLCNAQSLPVYSKALSNSVTTGRTQPFRLASNNQFHQLTVIASDITAGSCSGGWSGSIQLEASQDNVTYSQFSLPITSVADNALAYTSTSGAFGYVIINYISGNTGSCAITAWYSGTVTGVQSYNTPVPPATPPTQIAGNNTLFNGQQAVTASAVALPANASSQVCVKAAIANVTNVYLGSATVTTTGATGGYELAPDEAVCLPIANSNKIYIIGTVGALVSWSGTAN